jgi:hypothetical protein
MPVPSPVLRTLALLAALALPLAAAEAKAKKKDGEDEGPKLLMTQPGKLLLDEPFTAETWAKNWAKNWHKGDWQIVNDQMRVAQIAADGHHPEIGWGPGGPLHNVVARCKFKYDGAQWMGFGFTDKEHVARIMITNDGFELVKMSGIGPTTKGERLDRQSVKWDKDRWYTMTIELLGAELLANLDDQYVLYGESKTFDIDKNRFTMIVGGQYGWFDEMKVWEALPDPKWEKKKAAVLAQKEKRK